MEELVFFGAAGSFLDLVQAGGLVVRPALGKLVDRGDFIVDDRILIDGWTYDAESFGTEQIDQALEVLVLKPARGVHGGLGVRVLEQIQ